MTDKAPNLIRDIDHHHGHVKTKKGLDHEKLLNDAIENEEVRENLEYMHSHTPTGQSAVKKGRLS